MIFDAFKLAIGVYTTSQLFPCHSYPVRRIANKFTVTGADGCGYDTVRFKMDGDTAFHSAWWYFGDRDSAQDNYTRDTAGRKLWQGVVHQYKQPGSYYVRLACGLGPCGYRQWVGDSVHIKFKPTVSIVPTSQYTCGKNQLDLAVSYRLADTLHLWLNNKDSIIYTQNSDTPTTIHFSRITIDSGITAGAGMTAADSFAVRVSNSQCSDSVSYIHQVNILPAPIAAFQTNNPASCGSSSFAFSDTGKLGGMVKWHIGNMGWDTTISSTLNTLNITLTDTGKYTVTLTKTSSQGCVDSLSKPDYVWVHPLPEPRILVDGKMVHATGKVDICFGDSARLTVIPAKAGIPAFARNLWNTNDTSASISVPMPSPFGGQGTYSVQVWDEWNCFASSEQVLLKWLPKLTVNLYKTLDSITAKTNRPVAAYAWLRNSQPTTHPSQPFLYHADSGTYTVTVTDSNGCTATSSPLKYTAAPLPPEGGRLAWIYPNPTTGEFSLEVSSPPLGVGGLRLSILDLSGRTLLHLNPGQRTFSTTPLARGMYLLAISLNGQPMYVKLVKE